MLKPESIIIVDDDVDVLQALEAELQDFYNVTPAYGAEQALAHLQCRDFAAIISDVRMPGVDGLSLISQCAVRYPNMVRIILTAFDGDDVRETALGPHGAFKLNKPWGDDLLITLQNALKQRQCTIELRRHLDLKTELLDLDRRLHTALDVEELIEQAAEEMMRIPEVIVAAVYQFDADGSSQIVHVVRSTEESTEPIPELRTGRSTPVAYQGHYLYSVPIGEWTNPFAAVALCLSSAENDTVNYLDFIGRQAYRTLQLIKSAQITRRTGAPTVYPAVGVSEVVNTVSAARMLKELTTPATVVTSAKYGLERHLKTLKESALCVPEVKPSLDELTEVMADLASISRHLSILIDHLKKIDEEGEHAT